VLVPFSALVAMAGLLSFDAGSVSGYHFQIRRPGEVKESEGNPFWGFLSGIRARKGGGQQAAMDAALKLVGSSAPEGKGRNSAWER
jgi:hypothetical protein